MNQHTGLSRLLAIFTVAVLAATQLEGQITLIEENFDEAAPGARLAAVEKGDRAAGIRPTHGKYIAFMNDEAEIVPGLSGEGQALQFKDTLKDATLRFLFGVTDVDPVTTGKIEASLDFRVDSEGPLGPGSTLQVRLGAPTMSAFLVVVLSDGGSIMHTNGETEPVYRGMVRGESILPGIVYTLKITANLETSTYDVTVQEKEKGERGIVWQATGQKFVPIPDLANNGLGANLLDLRAGSQGLEPPVTVTVDNILVRHL